MQNITPSEEITISKDAIYTLRGIPVILDQDLAELYGTETRRLNEQVKRNRTKFPEDFMFQLTKDEFNDLKSQFATSSWGGRRSLPYAFTEYGALQVANLIRSETATKVSLFVIRAFVQLKEMGDRQTHLNTSSNKKANPILAKINEKLQSSVERMLETVVDQKSGLTVREEVHDVIHESITHLKARLQKTGLENEEIAARITKILAEAEHERAITKKTHLEAEQIEFNNNVKKLRLVLEAQRLMSGAPPTEEEDILLNRFTKILRELEK